MRVRSGIAKKRATRRGEHYCGGDGEIEEEE